MSLSLRGISLERIYRAAATRSARRVSYLAVLIVVALALRLAYVVTHSETGPGLLWQFAQDATAGWFGWKHEPVHDVEPSRQADFWLAKVDRLLAEQPTSERARTVAWMLDSPGTGFQIRNLRSTGFAQVPLMPDSEAISRAVGAFEAKATPRCIAAAELATQIAPDDVQSWRTLALLLFGPPFSPDEGAPRIPDWREKLAEAAGHDPDNALYDYLAADRLWRESTEYDLTKDEMPLVVRDAGKFAESAACFERAQQKPFVRGPDSDSVAVQSLLSRAGIPRHEQPALINSRWCLVRETQLLFHLCRMCIDLANREPAQSSLPPLRGGLRLVEQIEPVTDLARLQAAKWIHETVAREKLKRLRDLRHELEASAAATLEQELLDVYMQNMIWDAAARDVQPPSSPAANPADLLYQPLLDWLLSTAVLFAGIATGAALVCRGLLRWRVTDRRTLGVIRASVCWLVAFGISIVLLGLAPAEVVGISAQHAVTRAVVLNLPWIAAVAAIVYLLRRRNWRFSLREFVFVAPIVGPLILWWFTLSIVATIEGEIGWHVPPRSVYGLDPALLQSLFPVLQPGSLEWSLFEWYAYGGPTVAMLLTLAIVASWSWRRAGRTAASPRPIWQIRLREAISSVRPTAAAAALFALIAFMAVAPAFLRRCEAEYQRQLAYDLTLPSQQAGLAARIKAIESDESQMRQFRTSAEEFVSASAP